MPRTWSGGTRVSNSRTAALVVAVLVVSLCPSVKGEGASAPASIGLVARGCGADLREVRELADRLGVELAKVRIEARETPPLVEVSTSCTAVESVTFRDGDSTQTRPVSLDDIAPELRPVALAVLTAEFLRSIWATPAAPVPLAAEASNASPPPESAPPPTAAAPTPAPAPSVPPIPPPRAPEDHPARDHKEDRRPEPNRRLHVGAGALVRAFANPGTLLLGGELSLVGPVVFAGVNAAGGSGDDLLGQVSVGVVALTLGGRWKLARSGGVTWWGVAAADIGWSWASAIPADPRSPLTSSGAMFGALTLGPELDIPLSGSFGLALGIRAGAARGIVATADHREVAGAQGFTLSTTATITYEL